MQYRARINLLNGCTRWVTLKILQKNEHVLRVWLPRSEVGADVETVDFLPDFCCAKAGDEGFYVVPTESWNPAKYGCMLAKFHDREDMEYQTHFLSMYMYGVKTPDICACAIVTGMPYDYRIVVGVKDNQYYIYPQFMIEGQRPEDDLCVEFHMLSGEDANYSGMARAYRQYQLQRGACVPLAARLAGNDELAYTKDSVYVRIRLAWKPCPTPEVIQTPENEPPMKIVLKFEDVEKIIDEFQRQGVEKAELCLVGWNRMGHDGRFPQHFPVEEALGGEVALRHLIQKAQDAGYQITCHTCNLDAYEIAECWDEEYLLRLRSGELYHHHTYGSGRAYYVCPQRAYERFALEDMPRIRELGFKGTHYIDELSIYPPIRCYDPRHPLTRKGHVDYYNKLGQLSRDLFGGFSSEGAFDHMSPTLDYALYTAFTLMDGIHPMFDEHVPLWQLVYHGIIMSNPSAETVNYSIKDWKSRLKALEYGARPVLYYYAKHVTGNRVAWMGQEDLTCDTPEDLVKSVEQVRKVIADYDALKHLQTEFMEEHCQLQKDVFMTRYSSGHRYAFNYTDEDVLVEGVRVPAHDYACLP